MVTLAYLDEIFNEVFGEFDVVITVHEDDDVPVVLPPVNPTSDCKHDWMNINDVAKLCTMCNSMANRDDL